MMDDLLEITEEMWEWLIEARKNLSPDKAAFDLANSHPDWPRFFLIEQVEGYQKSRYKLSDWRETSRFLFPKRLSLQQASSRIAALYKAHLIKKNATVLDMTCGFGVDALTLAEKGCQVTACETDKSLVEIVKHNSEQLRVNDNISILHQDSIEGVINGVEHWDWIVIDPARRDERGRKIVSLSDAKPNSVKYWPNIINRAKKVMIKTSPMLDITKAIGELSHIVQCHVLSVKNECKELLFIADSEIKSPHSDAKDIEIICVNLDTNDPIVMSNLAGVHNRPFMQTRSEIKRCLYLPNSSIMKVGLWGEISVNYELQGLNSHAALFTSDQLLTEFPGRIFQVLGSGSFSKKTLKSITDVVRFNIIPITIPYTNNQICRKLGIDEGGQHFLFCYKNKNEEFELAVAIRAS